MSARIAACVGVLLFSPSTFAQPTTLSSRSTGVFTGAGTAQPGLACSTPPTPASPMICSGFLASDVDGTLLDVTVTTPDASARHPLVAFVHGYGGSKNSSGSYVDRLLAGGYTVLRHSTRGFGDSWGRVNLSRADVEVADLRSLIAQIADDERLFAGPDKVNAAVAGASYGGGHSWLAAEKPNFKSASGAKDVSIVTVVPIATWSDLLASLRPNGAANSVEPPGFFKLSFLEGLFLSGIRRSPSRPYPNYPAYLWIWNAYGLATEPNNLPPVGTSLVSGLTVDRSIFWRQDFWAAVRSGAGIPIFLAQGFTDDLFPLTEALRMYQAIRAIRSDYPIAAYFGDIGHPRAANKSDEVNYALNLVVTWLDHYMKDPTVVAPSGITAAITRPGAPFTADVVRAPDWEHFSSANRSVSFAGEQIITFDPANVSGLFVDPLLFAGCDATLPAPCPAPPPAVVPGDVAVYSFPAAALASDPTAQKVLIAGQPAVTAHVSTFAPREQLDARLFVVAGGARELITRGTITLDSGAPLRPFGAHDVALTTYGNLFEVNTTDFLELELTNVDSPYLSPSRVPSVTRVSDVTLTVPVRCRATDPTPCP